MNWFLHLHSQEFKSEAVLSFNQLAKNLVIKKCEINHFYFLFRVPNDRILIQTLSLVNFKGFFGTF